MNNGLRIFVLVFSFLIVNVSSVSSLNGTEIEDDSNEMKSYRGYKLIRVTPKDTLQAKLLQNAFDDDAGEVIIQLTN